MSECHVKNNYRIKIRKNILKQPMGRNTVNYEKVEYYPLITSRNDDAPNFSMRFFRINPGGYTNEHKHSFEHEVYVMNGKGFIIIDGKKLKIEKDNYFIIHPYEEHQLFTEKDVLEFLCIVPNRLKNQPE